MRYKATVEISNPITGGVEVYEYSLDADDPDEATSKIHESFVRAAKLASNRPAPQSIQQALLRIGARRCPNDPAKGIRLYLDEVEREQVQKSKIISLEKI